MADTARVSVSAVERARIRWHAGDVNDAVLNAFAIYQRSQNIAATTVKNRGHLLRGFTARAGIRLLDATVADLRADLARDGVEPGTLRTERGALQAFYRFAVEDGYLTADPSAALRPVRVPKGVARPFSLAQVEAMLATTRRPLTRAMILLGYYQGFRVSQIARVRGDDIDLSSGRMRTVVKGNKLRWVPVHPVIAELAPDMPSGYWFPSRGDASKPMRSGSVTETITRAKRRAGITYAKLTPHSLRHSFGTELGEAGVDVRVIQELMLHESIQSTQIYTGVSERRKREGIGALPPVRLAA